MNDTSKSHPAVALALDGFAKYKNGSLDIAGLGSSLSSACALLENSLPKPVQEALEWADGELESIRFTVDAKNHAREVERIRAKVEGALSGR
jgi:cysteine sulfinate desulfinase/cysteine desulfurase-like protein